MAQELKAEWGRSLPGDLLKRWPRNADGELVSPALLTKCTGIDMDDVLLVNMLEAYGIPCLKTIPGTASLERSCWVCPVTEWKFWSRKRCLPMRRHSGRAAPRR